MRALVSIPLLLVIHATLAAEGTAVAASDANAALIAPPGPVTEADRDDAAVLAQPFVPQAFREWLLAQAKGDAAAQEKYKEELVLASPVFALLSLSSDGRSGDQTRVSALRILTRAGTPEVMRELLERARRGSANYCTALGRAMDDCRTPQALAELQHACRDGTDRLLGGACVKALARIGNEDVVLSLLKLHRSDETSDEDRAAIRKALAAVERPEAAPALARAVRTTPRGPLLAPLCAGLRRVGGTPALQALLESAAEANVTNPERRNILNTREDECVRGQPADSKVWEMVAQLATHPHQAVRKETRELLKRQDKSSTASQILQGAPGEPEAGLDF